VFEVALVFVFAFGVVVVNLVFVVILRVVLGTEEREAVRVAVCRFALVAATPFVTSTNMGATPTSVRIGMLSLLVFVVFFVFDS
jgi:hypothetical protein